MYFVTVYFCKKSMVGRSQVGQMGHWLHQANTQGTDNILGGIPAIFFGDFSQLPPVADSPMYSDKTSSYCIALHTEGQHVFESFKQFVTLSTIFCQTSQDPKQVKFREPCSD
jgi:hypothetical protein